MWTKIPVQQCERLIPSYHESFLTQGQVGLDTTNKKNVSCSLTILYLCGLFLSNVKICLINGDISISNMQRKKEKSKVLFTTLLPNCSSFLSGFWRKCRSILKYFQL